MAARIDEPVARIVLVAIAVSLAAGCKPGAKGSSAPQLDGIDDAERALSDNARRLSEAGVVLPAQTASFASPAADDDGAAGLGGSDDGAKAEEDEGPPAPQKPSPDPEPEPRTDAMQATSGASDRSAESDGTRASKRSSRCTKVCDLAEVSCDLAQQICELADRHASEERYGRACARAGQQCTAASNACDSCEAC